MSEIKIGGKIESVNTKYNIEKAKILQSYVSSLEKEIESFKVAHEIENEKINTISFELYLMNKALNKIQTLVIERSNAEDIIENIIENLKNLKNDIRSELKIELTQSKQELVELKNVYTNKANNVATRFTLFVGKFTPRVHALKESEKKELILQSLVEINKESSKLSLLETKDFQSKKQLRDYYSNSIRSIKRELKTIQAIITQM